MAGAPERRGEGFLGRLRRGLRRSHDELVSRIRVAFGGGRVDPSSLEELEEALFGADLGPATVMEIVDRVEERSRRGACDPDAIVELARESVAEALAGRDRSLRFSDNGGPTVLLFVGVNGTGKTTTIGKLTGRLISDGHRPLLAACDTFRAAAVEQLAVWAERTGAELVRGQQGGDAAAVAWDAVEAAGGRGCDVVLVDSAGRLHTQANLMDELGKLRRVIERRLPGAPHETLLVVDATTGSNALVQARRFHAEIGVTGVVLTKLDGTSRGGIVVAIERELGLPVKFIGLGEGVDDLEPFDPAGFAAALVGTSADDD